MQHPDEGTIHAWLDGQLSPQAGAEVESHARECGSCAAAIAEARGLVAASSRIVSALDIVPGGVIPGRDTSPVARRRPWYAGTQLRAAAAVLFLAAASMLVLRDRGSAPVDKSASRAISVADTETSQALDESSPQPTATAIQEAAAASAPTPTTQSAKTSMPSRAPSPVASSGRALGATGAVQSTPQSDAAAKITSEQDFSGRGVASNQAEPRPLERRAAFGAVAKAAPAVTVGAAAERDAARQELVLVRADTAGTAVVRVYRVADGIEVTLTETPPAPSTAATGRRRETARQVQSAEAAAPSLPPPPAVSPRDSVQSLPVVSLTWIDPATKRTYTLSGRLPRERLDQLRKAIEQERR